MTTRSGDGRYEGLTANSFSAASLDPPLVLWSLGLRAPSLDGLRGWGHFVVNVLSSAQSFGSRHFATPHHEKLEEIAFSPGIGGSPMLDDSLAIFECRTENMLEGGDHVIFIGRVMHARYRDGGPLMFAAGRYGTHAPLSENA